MSNRQKTLYGQKKPLEAMPVGRTLKQCHCGQWYSLPSCHAHRHKSCSADCSQRKRDSIKKSRELPCEICGAKFLPRTTQLRLGQGRFCSNLCATRHVRTLPSFQAAYAQRGETLRRGYETGRLKKRVGPEHHQWTGGPKAAMKRRIASGKAAAHTREYRKQNPERVREWTQKRSNGKQTGKLPYGTIPKIFALQKRRCAYCKKSINASYHVDHVVPLAKGGQHVPHNIQLLCVTCNLTKSDKHPIAFAQSKGLLL